VRQIKAGHNLIKIDTHPKVYEPSEDSYLMLDSVEIKKGETVLDIGTGTGILAIYAALCGGDVSAIDINPFALELAEKNAEKNKIAIKIIQSDLFENVRGRYGVIIFNPPYVPTPEKEKTDGFIEKAWDGGPDGTKGITRFLCGFDQHLAAGGRVYLLISSLNDVKAIKSAIAAKSFSCAVKNERNLSGEILYVLKLVRSVHGSAE
jgi:release factor glutamine methyltransferase